MADADLRAAVVAVTGSMGKTTTKEMAAELLATTGPVLKTEGNLNNRYGLPLTLLGWLVAAYHNLVYAGIVPESLQPCAKGVSCTEEYIRLFGLLSIPALSLIAFTTLAGLLIALQRRAPR